MLNFVGSQISPYSASNKMGNLSFGNYSEEKQQRQIYHWTGIQFNDLVLGLFCAHCLGEINDETCPGVGSTHQPSDQKSTTLPLDYCALLDRY